MEEKYSGNEREEGEGMKLTYSSESLNDKSVLRVAPSVYAQTGAFKAIVSLSFCSSIIILFKPGILITITECIIQFIVVCTYFIIFFFQVNGVILPTMLFDYPLLAPPALASIYSIPKESDAIMFYSFILE